MTVSGDKKDEDVLTTSMFKSLKLRGRELVEEIRKVYCLV